MFKLKNLLSRRVKSVFLLFIFVFSFLTLNGCSVALIAPVCDFLESTPENVCFKSENPSVTIYSGNAGIFGEFENDEVIQYFQIASTMGGEIELGITNNFISMDCPYFDDNIIKFEIWEEHVGEYFPSDVTALELKRKNLTEEETDKIKEEYEYWKREANLYLPKSSNEALANFGPKGELVSRYKPKYFESITPDDVFDDLKNEVYIELPHDTVFETKGDKKEGLINYVYVPHKEYCESYISYNCLIAHLSEAGGETVYANLEDLSPVFGYAYKWDEPIENPSDYPIDDKYIRDIKKIIKNKNITNGLFFFSPHPSLTDDSIYALTAFIAKEEDTDKYIFILNGVTNNRTFKHGKIVGYNESEDCYFTEKN